ncbi:MAG: leucine-rich repeat domain-containing protein [Clostridia bacterium]|nr:leucine-rich repeat domain-containing protein [Clostridia bacterium]
MKRTKLVFVLMTISFVIFLINNHAVYADTNVTILFGQEQLFDAVVEQLEVDFEIVGTRRIGIAEEELAKVKKLDVSNLTILNISGIEKFTSLTELNLSNNRIVDISLLSNLKNLTKLEIYGNSITDLSAISKLTNLTYLDVSSNTLVDSDTFTPQTAITYAIKDLTSLKYLNMAHNYIQYTNGLTALVNLETLNLYDNGLKGIAGLSELTHLKWLNLGENNEKSNKTITSLNALKNLTKLEYFNFSENNTPEILDYLGDLKELVEINLESNKISDLSKLTQNTKLEKINLYNNNIKDISSLYELANIKELVLQKNNITSLNGMLDDDNQLIWKNMKKLDISSNGALRSGATNINTINILAQLFSSKGYELNFYIVDSASVPHFDSAGIPYVTYEDFGARCDGIYDDFIAIRNAHVYANSYSDAEGNKCEVRATAGKTYHIFKYNGSGVAVNTNVNWNNATFIIHDENIDEVSGRYEDIFIITNILEASKILDNPDWTINKDTTNIYDYLSEELSVLNQKGYQKYYCRATNSDKKQYVRYGMNASSGYDQCDNFLIDSDRKYIK